MKWCFHIHIDMYKYNDINELMTISDKQYDQLS